MPQTIGRPPDTLTFTQVAAGVAVEIDPDDLVDELTFEFVGTTGSYAFEGTDGVALAADKAVPIQADRPFNVRGVQRQDWKLYLQADAPNTVIHVTAEDR